MTNRGIDIQHPKLRGEWAELRFMARAAEHGLRVSKPFGDCADYDVAVERGGNFLRVQVKSTQSPEKAARLSFVCDIRRRRSRPYHPDDLDFFAIYVVPCDVWYILPSPIATAGRGNLTFSPQNPKSKYAPYQEAWYLLCGEEKKLCPALSSPPSEDVEPAPDNNPMSAVEARFRAIQWNPILPAHWKPRR